MSPLIFVPAQFPHDARGWLTAGWVLLIGVVLHRRGEPRSALVWLLLGYFVGRIYGRGDWGGAAGAVVGALAGIASARINTINRP